MTIGRRADGRLCVRASHYEAQMLAPGDVGPLTVDPRLHDEGDGQACEIAADNPNTMPAWDLDDGDTPLLYAAARFYRDNPAAARLAGLQLAPAYLVEAATAREIRDRQRADSLAQLVELRESWRELVTSWREGRGPSRDVLRLAYVELYQAELLHRVLWGDGPSDAEPVGILGHHMIDAAIDDERRRPRGADAWRRLYQNDWPAGDD